MSISKYVIILSAVYFFSCSSYRQHIMFKTGEDEYPQDFSTSLELAEKNYRIQINDRLEIRVYTNEGERIIDPDYELQKDLSNNMVRREETYYFVERNGEVKIPLLGKVKVDGMTIREAEALLEEQFAEFYKDPYVTIKFVNKRVIVLGALGGHVIPLENEDMNVLEILALAGGVEKNTKVHNIRLIRGDLDDPEIVLIDLSTIEGMKNASLNVYSGDIVYVEPVVRIISESTRDLVPLISILTSTVALIIAILRI